MEKLNILRCNGSISLKEFATVEEILKVKLPFSFKNIISECDAGMPEKNSINFFDKVMSNINGSCIGRFLSFKKGFLYPYGRIIDTNKIQIDFARNNLIAFAVDPFGNYFCFDYREGKDNPNPPIVFWNHEGAGTEEAVSFLAKDFEGFLKMLKSEEEADREYEELKKQQEDTSK